MAQAGIVAAVRTVHATRYVTPLREGGSMPGLVEADDDGLYVLKFRGAGQGAKALVAEIVAGELARACGLAVPEIVLIELDPQLGAAEPDPEIQELIAASAGLNVGARLPPGLADLQPGRRRRPAARARRRDRLARRADHQRRPLAAEPEPADVARAAVADRPRRRALPPARVGGPARRRAAPVPRDPQPRAAAARPATSGRPTSGSRRGSPARWSTTSSPRCPATGSPRAPARSTRRTCTGGSRPRAGSPPRPRRRAVPPSPFQYAIVRVVPRVERGECVNAGVVLFCRPRRFLAARVALDAARVLRARARRRPGRGARPPRRVRADRGGRSAGRADGGAPAVGALPLARRAVEHGDPVLAGPHRAHRRPAGRARAARRAPRGMSRVVWVGHATALIEVGGARLLTDPLLRSRLAHLRRHGPPPAPEATRDLDAVLISHLHHDHLDLPSLRLLPEGTPLVVPRGAGKMLRRRGFAEVRELAAGESTEVAGVEVLAVDAVHDGHRLRIGPQADTLGYVAGGARLLRRRHRPVRRDGGPGRHRGRADPGLGLGPVARGGPPRSGGGGAGRSAAAAADRRADPLGHVLPPPPAPLEARPAHRPAARVRRGGRPAGARGRGAGAATGRVHPLRRLASLALPAPERTPPWPASPFCS